MNRGRALFALSRYLRWQVGSRLVPGAVAVPFVDGTRLLVEPGMTGATGNIYCGLHEFADMAFVLHALRPGDVFVDVGANIGSYTVLAAGGCGASVIAIEPVPFTSTRLIDNIRLNNIESLVVAKNTAVGAAQGHLRFTTTLDTMNHVLCDSEAGESAAISVPMNTVDAILDGRKPVLVKIDVEGYESEVVRGAEDALKAETLLAVLMEITVDGNPYGFDGSELHSQMAGLGFTLCAYDPATRELTASEIANVRQGNGLYVRDLSTLRERIKSAPERAIHGTRL
ncbi:MAG: FkbM family methyltransferase [Syntrophobacteraceae bacterium]|nr:FkbM family methyltransferase [Syntrophobacteraceae bacterium]